MTISGDPNPDNSSSSLDDDIEDDTYVPSPRAHPHGKGLASASGSRARRDDEIEEEPEEGAIGNDGEEKKRCLMWKKSTLLTMLTWDLLCSGNLQTVHGG
jgi:hypothetical protein